MIDCSPLPNLVEFLSATCLEKYSFLFTSQQSSGFVDLVGVTCNGLCQMFHRTVLRSCETLPMFVGYSPKQFSKLSALQTPIMCVGHVTTSNSMTSSCAQALIANSATPIKTRVLRLVPTCAISTSNVSTCTCETSARK